jgi:hypothetical protein
MPDEVWLTRKEAANYLTSKGFPVAYFTLRNLAYQKNIGKGPPFRRFGWRTVRYRQDLLLKWAQERSEDL